MKHESFESALDAYLLHIKLQYRNWQTLAGPAEDPIAIKVKSDMLNDFYNSIRVDYGSKYVKIVSNNSVHSFIVGRDTDKFKCGDILKAASWKKPATNFIRGNILDGTFDRVSWTGADL
jgi:hypothetical protein